MSVDRATIINILKRIHLFRGVDEQKIGFVADLVQQVELNAGAVIFHEDDDPDYFYIIASGRVRASRFNHRERQLVQLGFYDEDDYFGEEVLETTWPRQISAEAVTDVSLLRLSIQNWVDILEQIPPMGQRLQFILDSYKLSLKTPLVWADPEETIYFISRRHNIFLWMMILPPTVFGTMSIPFMLYFYMHNPLSMTLLGLLMLFVLVTVLWWIWQYIDWTNDYYFVTNRRVVYQERVIFFYDSRLESPLEAVQSTQTTTSQWGRWLGYGNVSIRTFIGTIMFRRVPMPEQVMALIQEYQTRAQFYQHRSELRSIKELIDKRVRAGVQPPVPPGPKQPKPRPSPMQQFMQEFLATMFHLRYEAGGAVIYRTHWFILLQKVGLQSLLLAGLAFLFILSTINPSFISVQAVCGLTFVFGSVIFGWWLYQYLDWHNDIYLITSDQVVDVNKKPLGREMRQAAPLKNIISIEYKRLGIIGLLLNFGTVYIRVGDKELTFDDVYNPSEVQRELFHKLTAKNYAEKQAQAAQDNQRFADWFATYNEWHVQNPQAHPSQPPRTPPSQL